MKILIAVLIISVCLFPGFAEDSNTNASVEQPSFVEKGGMKRNEHAFIFYTDFSFLPPIGGLTINQIIRPIMPVIITIISHRAPLLPRFSASL